MSFYTTSPVGDVQLTAAPSNHPSGKGKKGKNPRHKGGSSSTLLNDLVSWWTLDEESGTRADSHGSNTLSDPDTLLYRAGKVGNALDCTGGNVTRAFGHGCHAGSRDFSVAFWMYPDTTMSLHAPMACAQTGSASATQWLFQYDGGAMKFYVPSSSVYYNAVSAIATPASAWYLVVGTYNFTTNTISIIINDNTPDTGTGPTTPNAPTFEGLFIGEYFFGSTRDFDGLIDEAAFWSKELSAAEITELYNSGSGITYTDL